MVYSRRKKGRDKKRMYYGVDTRIQEEGVDIGCVA
jgi:hypothetical protein